MISSSRWAIFPLSVFLFSTFAYGQEDGEDTLEPWTEPGYVKTISTQKDDVLLFLILPQVRRRIAITTSSPEEKEEIKRLTDTVFRSFIRHSKVRVRLDSATGYVKDIEEVETKNY